jgi:hypothetical protein
MQTRAARTVDIAMVVRNWLFGWYIVEFEQNGADRAEYGSRFLENLSVQLKQAGIKGTSSTRLKLYRSFYQQYKQICPTVTGASGEQPAGLESTARQLKHGMMRELLTGRIRLI